MKLAWSTGTTGIDGVRSMATARRWPRKNTAFYQNISISGDVSAFIGQALCRHEHIVAVSISAAYYTNPNAKRYGLPGGTLLPLYLRGSGTRPLTPHLE
jgi:hypothetical protein